MPRAVVGLLSPGDMGIGIAKLLIANGYRVISNVTGRSIETKTSKATHDRANKASVELVETDESLCASADYVLSIVPPRDALATAQRIIKASTSESFGNRKSPLYFLDLNAISPRSAREINALLNEKAPAIRHIDGGIIGGPPVLKDGKPTYRPGIPVSGPFRLDQAQPDGEHLTQTLNVRHINETIGSATGLKMCFASIGKGFAGLALQCYTTAQNLGVTAELQEAMDEFSPGRRAQAERMLVSVPPKAYRWVHEMEEIADTFEADGGFTPAESIFRSMAQIYELVANGSELGKEQTENRVRGTTAEDVAQLMTEATAKRQSQG